MLEKIKELLKIDNEDKDSEIQLYIEMLEDTILDITGLKKVNKALENFIVSKVVAIMKDKGIGNTTSQNTNEISSIKRGDITITYNTPSKSSVVTTSSDVMLSEKELSFVNSFRKLRYF